MLPVRPSGAQRASGPHSFARVLRALLAVLLACGFLAQVEPVLANAKKVVIVVGPTGSRTADFIQNADWIANRARGYGASVYQVYSPNATWSRVKDVAQGANLLVYLGHGNGWPSPYAPYQPNTKNGMGLNATAGDGHYNTKYWGEYYLANELNLAPNAVVILNRLCYASGNSEWGAANPTLTVAKERVDNFGAGFLRTGAKAVFAEGITSTGYIVDRLFKSNLSMSQIFWSSPNNHVNYPNASYDSKRTPGEYALLDPSGPGQYYRSFIGHRRMTAADWR